MCLVCTEHALVLSSKLRLTFTTLNFVFLFRQFSPILLRSLFQCSLYFLRFLFLEPSGSILSMHLASLAPHTFGFYFKTTFFLFNLSFVVVVVVLSNEVQSLCRPQNHWIHFKWWCCILSFCVHRSFLELSLLLILFVILSGGRRGEQC